MPLPRRLFDPAPPQDADLSVVSGTWPADCVGELVISAPHPDTFGGPHPFFGEGMVHRLSLSPDPATGTLAWRQARVDSPSARLRAKRPELFEATMTGVRSPFGHTNAANTAPLPWGDRLFLTWDAGRPVEIDPVELTFLGEVGHRDDWHTFDIGAAPVLPLIMSTAHPVIDPDRNVMWTVNTHWGALHIVCWDGRGPIRSWPVTGAVIPQSVHTITQTRDWLIVADCAYKVEPQVLAGGERTEPANPSEPVYLIRKADLESTPPGTEVPCRMFELAPEVNHYYATYDDSDGVQILFEHTQDAELSMTQRVGDLDALGRPCDPALAGLYSFPMAPDLTTLVVFDPETGTVAHRARQCEPELLWSRQLNAIDWSTEGRTRPSLHHTVHHGWRPEAITQRLLALYGDRVDRSRFPAEETPAVLVTSSMPDLTVVGHHEFGPEDLPTSPIFVPRALGSAGRSRYAGADPGGHDGYVVVPVLNDLGFRVEVFDAADVSRGPLAVAASPGFHVPFVLHAAWMPRARRTGDGTGVRFAEELDRIGELPAELQEVVLAVARELDEGVPA